MLFKIMQFMKKIFLALALFFSVTFVHAESPSFRLAKNIDVYFSILQELDMYYVDTIDHERIIRTSIDKMLKSLDPYTVFIPESEVGDFDFSTTGQYGGVGALIRKRGDAIEVAEPYKGFPADRAGLRPGDLILSVDGQHVDSKNVAEVSAALKGKIGTPLHMQVLKFATKDTVTLTMERSQIQLPSVPYFGLLPNSSVGYICFSSFTKDCSEEVKNAMDALKHAGAKGLILDLRSNTGGLLNEAVKIVNLFVPKGQEVVSVRGRVGGEVKYKTDRIPLDSEIPLVVLTNSLSASSSEIVAGALQDLDRAVIVGQRSYGKGLVQSVRPLPFNEKFKLTTAKYYTPSGRCVQAIDYTHRNADGSVGKIPDSLVRKFTTRAGRTVYDGGGIIPDERLTAHSTPQILAMLYAKNFFFDFANRYYVQHPTVESVAEFKLQEHDFQDFVKFARDSNFTYETVSSKAFHDLLKTLKKEKYYDDLKPELDDLETKLAPSVSQDFERFKQEISDMLEEEIASRYYYQHGRLEVSTRHDSEVKRAAEILNDPTLYKSFLQPKK